MRVHLRDINRELVEAWREVFDGCQDVEVSEGNIFGVQATAIVSPANSFGFMDGGIDLAYTRRFGWDLQGRLQDLLSQDYLGELPVGQAVIVPTLDESIPFVISAPTMRVPMDVSGTVNAYLAFRAALMAAREHNQTHPMKIESILCPGLATATGRMPPRRCARQMHEAYVCAQLGELRVPRELIDAVMAHERMRR